MESCRTLGLVSLVILLASQMLCESIPDEQLTPESTEIAVTDPVPTPELGTCSPDGPICYNCTTAPYCIRLPTGEFLNAGTYSCAEDDPSKPYCTEGVCSATPDSSCVSPTVPPTGFQCTDSGYFPDPNDCQKFHFCVGRTDNLFVCSSNYVYSHEKTACIRRKVSSDCAVIKCSYKTQFQYVLYPKDPNVYGLCVRDNPTIMLKCAKGEQFDIATSECLFLCKAEGFFPVQGDSKTYRECIRIGANKYQLIVRVCPEGSIFDAENGPCKIE